MGRWVTLDDDQHVYISDGGKVLATRSAISSAGGAKERGKALAARSKAAIGKAAGKVRAAAHNEAQAKELAKDIIASHGKDALKEVGRRLDRSAQYDRSVQGRDWQPSRQTNNLVAAKEHVQKHFESERGKALAARSKGAITRNAFSAVRARSFFKSGEEKGRLKSEISQHLANREHHEAAVKSKQLTELERQSQHIVKAKQPIDKDGRYYPGGTTAVERDAMKRQAAIREAQQSAATARAIEHARAAGPTGKAPDWVKGKTQGADENWKSIRSRMQQNQQYNQKTMKRRGITTAQLIAKLKAAH
jgi:hypothetical protein